MALSALCGALAASTSSIALPAVGTAIEDPMYVLLNRNGGQLLGRIDGYSVDAPTLTWTEVLPSSVGGVYFGAGDLAYDDVEHRLVFASSDGWRVTFIARDLATGWFSVLFDDTTLVQFREFDIDRFGVGYGQHVRDQSCLRVDFESEVISVVAPVVADMGDAVTIAPDGRVFTIDPDTVMRSVDVTTGAIATIGTTHLWGLAGIDFAADGRLFALTRSGQIYEVDPATCALRSVGFVAGVQSTPSYGADGMSIGTRQPPGWSTSCTAGAATLIPHGTGAVGGTEFSLLGSGLPPGALGYVIVSELDRAPLTSPLFAGELCLGSPIVRIGATLGAASPSGMFHAVLDLGLFPGPFGPVALVPGDVRHFQLWYRDVTPTTTSSFSSAAEVMFR